MKKVITMIMIVVMTITGMIAPVKAIKAEALEMGTHSIADIVKVFRGGENWETHRAVYLTGEGDWIYIDGIYHGHRYHIGITVWYTKPGEAPILHHALDTSDKINLAMTDYTEETLDD